MRYFTNVKEMLHAHNNNEQSHNLIGHGNRAKKINLTVSCREVTLPGHKTPQDSCMCWSISSHIPRPPLGVLKGGLVRD